MSLNELEELREQLEDLIESGYIQLSGSSYAVPVIFVNKKEGSLCLCTDYQVLNKYTSNLHNIDEQRFATCIG